MRLRACRCQNQSPEEARDEILTKLERQIEACVANSNRIENEIQTELLSLSMMHGVLKPCQEERVVMTMQMIATLKARLNRSHKITQYRATRFTHSI